jgi:hypothetical protein
MDIHRKPILIRRKRGLRFLCHCLKVIPSVRGAGTTAGQKCDLLVSEEHRWIYIGVPLVGTRTMIGAFSRADEVAVQRVKARPVDFMTQERQSRYHTFSIVRNPWSRVVSCYNKKILNCNDLGKLYFMSRYRGLRPMMSFQEFVEWLMTEEGSDAEADPHWLSQWKFLYDDSGVALYDTLGRLESFDADVDRFLDETGTPRLQLERRRASQDMVIKPLHRHYRDYYDESTMELVARRYARDIEVFGYSFRSGF